MRFAETGMRTTLSTREKAMNGWKLSRGLAVVLLLGGNNLAAQAGKTGADSAKAKLPIVTVTASRSGASLFSTPLAVTQLSKQSWLGKSGYGLNDALSMVPGVLAQSRYGNSDIRLTIRGFGARGAGDRSNAGTSRGVRILLNGIPETEPDGRTSFDGIDLATATGIEVVRSNASALWGNAAGGVVNINTVPEFSTPFAEEENIFGNFGLKRFALRGGTLAGTARLFGTVVNSSFTGWRANSMSSRTIFDGGIVAPLGDRTKFSALLMATVNRFNIPGPLTQAQVDANPQQANATYQSRFERRDNTIARLGLTLDHKFDDSQGFSTMLFLAPKILQRSERGTYRDFNRFHVGGNGVYRVSGEYGDGLKGTFSIGTDVAYQNGTILFYGLTAQGTRAIDLRDNKREGANNFGTFVNEDLELGSSWGLSLGARYDAITYTYSNNITPQINATRGFRGVTPKVGVTYKVNPTHNFYASVGGGVEVPAGNETDPAGTYGQDTVTAINPLLEPIRSLTYEVGTRHLFASGRDGFIRELSYDAAAFYTTVTNEIVPYRGGRFYFTAGKARRSGAELGATVRAEGGWSLQGAFTVMNATYTTYIVDSVHYGKPGKFADYSGKKVVGVPGTTANVNLGWAPQMLNGWRLEVGAQRTGDYFVDDANTVKVASSTVFTAGLLSTRAFDLGNGVGVRGSVVVQNLTDKRFIGSAFLNPDIVGGVPVAYEPGLPRQILLSFSFERLRY